MLELLLTPTDAEKRLWHVFLISFFYSFVAIIFSNFLFPSQASILTISLITILFIPFFQKLFEKDEKKEDLAAEGVLRNNLFIRHKNSIFILSAFFLGVIIAMSFVFIFFPSEQTFSLQKQWFAEKGIFPTAFQTAQSPSFSKLFLNNSQVMLMMFILSILFGAGAIFILAWNASIIAVYLGLLVKSFVENGFATEIAYLFGVPIGLGSIALHGIPEICAYFLAGLAGGILSIGIIKEDLASIEFRQILKDSVFLLLSAELLIILAAFLEAVV